MIKELRFVKGAISKKDFLPALSHFKISNGYITSCNGRISLCSPIPLAINATPKAEPFIKAIETCKSEVALHIAPNGRLAIHSGNFKAFIECTTDPFPEMVPGGKTVDVTDGFLEALAVLESFIAQDASRSWAMGILFKGQSAYATNNVILVEYWLGYTFPAEVNLPAGTVRELLRIGEQPIAMQISTHSVTFHYEGKRWLTSLVYETAWPDPAKVLNVPCQPAPVPAGLFDALRDLKPFIAEESRAWLTPGQIATQVQEETGAAVAVPDILHRGCFHMAQLAMLEGVADRIDLSLYPGPVLFFGANLRGAIMGMRE